MPNPDGTETPEEKAARKAQQQPSNYTNFNRYFNANKTAANNQATTFADQAQNKAQNAQNMLKNNQQQFATNVGNGAGNTALPSAQTLSGGGSYTDYEGQTYDPSMTLTDYAGQNSAEAAQKAGQKYTGPGGLTDITGFGDTVNSSIDAQNYLNNLGKQGSQFSSALMNQAGGARYRALKAQFNPEDAVGQAGVDAAKAADEAKSSTESNAKQWGDALAASQAKDAAGKQQVLDELSTSAEKEKKRTDAETNRDIPYEDRTYMYAGVNMHDPAEVKDAQEKYTAFQKAMEVNASDTIRSGMEGASLVHHVAQHVAGVNDPFTLLGNKLQQAVHGERNASGGLGQHVWWHPQDWIVYKQMTPEQWGELDQLNTQQQGDWIEKRRHELAPNWPPGTNDIGGGHGPRRQSEIQDVDPAKGYDQ